MDEVLSIVANCVPVCLSDAVNMCWTHAAAVTLSFSPATIYVAEIIYQRTEAELIAFSFIPQSATVSHGAVSHH
jgi:hypothetical protein